MKNLLLILLLLLTGEINTQQTTTIVVKTTPNNEIAYWPTGKDHLFFITLGTKAQADPQGQLVHEFSVSRPTTIRMWVKGNNSFMLYLTPGSKDTIAVAKDTINFSGTNRVYNRCLEAVDDYQQYNDNLIYTQPHELEGVTSLEQYHQLADARMKQALDSVNASRLDKELLAEQRVHIDCTYRSIFLHVAMYLVKNENSTENWCKELAEIINQPVDSDYLCSHRGVGLFINDLIGTQFIKLENGKPEGIKDYCSFRFDRYREFFKGDNLQYAQALLIYKDEFQIRDTLSIPQLYERYKTEFSNSPFLPVLKPGVSKNLRFQNSRIDDKDYYILPCDSTVENLEDMVEPFKGRVVHIDARATWCGPYIKKFQYLPALEEKTHNMDIVYLYISIDRPQDKEKWERTIGYHQLKGYHSLVNEKLGKSLYAELGDERRILSTPCFVVIDKTGKITIRHAAAPDEPEEVIEQLGTYYNE